MAPSGAISPTAHYTGFVWARNGLSHSELATLEGRVMFEAMRSPMLISRALGGPTLEAYLLARHRAIDALLERSIEERGTTQVIEVACGLSPRGWRFSRRYGERLSYVEADLPEMAGRKRRALERMGSLGDRHRVCEIDVLRASGPTSLAAVARGLDPGAATAIITEGLLGYLPREAIDGIWPRFATVLSSFAGGRYISDVHLASVQTSHVRGFRLLLSAFVRGRVHLHFDGPAAVTAALSAAGFDSSEVVPASSLVRAEGDPGGALAHILEASTP